MFAAIARLVSITIGVVTLTVLAVVVVRWVGTKQEYQAPHHVWFEKADWKVEVPDTDSLCKTPPPLKEGVILMVPVHRSRTEGWQVECKEPIALTTLLEKSLHADWMLKIDANDIPDLDKLVDSVGKFDGQKRFAVVAPAQKVARQLRKLAPQWLFAADSAALLRLHLFSSLQIAAATEFWPDFVIASMNPTDGSRLNTHEVEELKRRQKRILWNTLANPEAKPPFPVDGTLTRSP